MKQYRSYEEFRREEIQSQSRVGFSIDDLDVDPPYGETLLFDEVEADEDD